MAAETRTAAGGPARAASVAGLPAKVGRYVVVGKLGEGGMGVVYEAMDPELKRRVAVKVVRGRGVAGVGQGALLREAQAMAQLSHPSVVPVFDVGTVDEAGGGGGGVFIAMELVEGQTLRDWLKSARRPWKDVVKALVAAGRGLAAAHAAGIVHRDFKPANVLVGMDGRVRVTDFGLARVDDAVLGPDEAGEAGGVAGLTMRTAGVAGTPGYVAPEALDGVVDARGDQFAFCVSLYEALYGERPFAAATGSGRSPLIELAEEVRRGAVKPAPRGSRVPGWLRAIVVRGLSPDPDRRWPSLAAMLGALERVPRRRGQVLATLVAGVVAATVSMRTLTKATEPVGERPCEGFSFHLTGVWDDDARARLHAAMLATGIPRAKATWERVAERLDGYAAAWVLSAETTCRAAIVHQSITSAERDLRTRCLNTRLHSLRALTSALAAAPETTLDRAVAAAVALPELRVCEVPDLLSRYAAAPHTAAAAATVDAIEQDLARAEASFTLQDFTSGMVEATRAEVAARLIGHPALIAEAVVAQAEISKGADWPDALPRIEAALLIAESLGMDDSRFSLLLAQGTLHTQRRQFDVARGALASASAVLDRLPGGPHPKKLMSLFAAKSGLAQYEDRGADALRFAEQRLEWAKQLDPPSLLSVATAHGDLARALSEEGEHDRARAEIDASRRLLSAAVGPDHPIMGQVTQVQALVTAGQGDFDGAARLQREAVDRMTVTLGASHRRVQQALQSLWVMEDRRGAHDAALELARRGEAATASDPASRSISMRWTLFLALSELEAPTGDARRGLAVIERAYPELQQHMSPSDEVTAKYVWGRAIWQVGVDRARARSMLREAILEFRALGAGDIPTPWQSWLRAQGLEAVLTR